MRPSVGPQSETMHWRFLTRRYNLGKDARLKLHIGHRTRSGPVPDGLNVLWSSLKVFCDCRPAETDSVHLDDPPPTQNGLSFFHP